MKVNLRKAKALQEQILAEIKNIEITQTVTINEFESYPEEALRNAAIEFETAYANTNMLYEIYYNIRAQVAEVNADTGVSKLLAELAYCEKMIGVLTAVIPKNDATDINIINAKLSQIRATTPDKRTYGYQDVVVSRVLDAKLKKEYNGKLSDLKRRKIKLQDQLLNLNVVSEIELSEIDAGTLKYFELI